MRANNEMQPNLPRSPQFATFAEPSTTIGNANPVVAVNVMAEDQLAHFMNRAMTLQHSSLASEVGSFLGCPARFNGTRDDRQLKKFILNVTLYKDAQRMNDEIALHELPLLLEGEAAIWWHQVKENIYVWSEALKMLEKEFLQKRPAYQIYAEIFATKQDEFLSTEIFVRQKQALLAELPHPHPEEVQIDMIYSLLDLKIQKKIPREMISSLEQLIKISNRVEHKKNKKRMKRFVNFDLYTKPVRRPKEKCSHCRKLMGSRVVDCYNCNLLQRKASKEHKQETPLTTINPINVIPLCGFNPDSNPFNK